MRKEKTHEKSSRQKDAALEEMRGRGLRIHRQCAFLSFTSRRNAGYKYLGEVQKNINETVEKRKARSIRAEKKMLYLYLWLKRKRLTQTMTGL